jgi:hypothetical protein
MLTKRHLIGLAGLVVFALCVAATTSSTDLALRTKGQGSRIGLTTQRDSDDFPDLAPSTSPTTPGLRWTAATRLRASSPLAFLQTAIPPAGAVMLAPVWERFHESSFLSLYATLRLSVPSGRAPPSL